MNRELTDIVVVLDRSGSMASLLEDTLGGFNTFLEDQKRVKGRARLTLTQFDNEYEIVHERMDIQDVPVPALTRATYVPRGSTALLDALGRTITTVRGRISAEADSEKPWKVVFVIITDGEENASQEFTRQQVFDLISEQERKDGWEFLYLGANQDAIGEATRIGISRDKAADWKKARALGRISAAKLRMLREMGDPIVLAFDEAERRELEEDDDDAVSRAAPERKKRYN